MVVNSADRHTKSPLCRKGKISVKRAILAVIYTLITFLCLCGLEAYQVGATIVVVGIFFIPLFLITNAFGVRKLLPFLPDFRGWKLVLGVAISLLVSFFVWVAFVGTSSLEVVLEVSTPQDNSRVVASSLEIRGSVSPNFAKVEVAGQVLDVNEAGSFSGTIPLSEGRNEILVEAKAATWRSSGENTKKVAIIRELSEEEKIAKAKAEEEARKKGEEEEKIRAQAEEEARRRAEEAEAKHQAEEAQRQAEEAAKRQAEEEARRKAESPEEQIKKLVQGKLEGTNNMGYPYEDTIEVEQALNGKYNVLVEFNADDNLSKGMIKTGIQIKIAEILKPLFTERGDVQEVTVIALFPLQDKYGRSFRGGVYKAVLNTGEASKVNWGIDSATLALTILPAVYKVSYPYPIF